MLAYTKCLLNFNPCTVVLSFAAMIFYHGLCNKKYFICHFVFKMCVLINYQQSLGRYTKNVTSYILLVTLASYSYILLTEKSDKLHITR